MSDQDLVVETVRDILTGYEPFVLTPERRGTTGCGPRWPRRG